MTAISSSPTPTVVPVKPVHPNAAAKTSPQEPEMVEHPFAEFDIEYEGVMIPASEVDNAWNEDQSKEIFGEDGLTFDDFLDIINPLQHLPVVSTIYRELTGDTIEPGSRIAGGALYGGALGFVGALVNAVIEDSTGRDIGDHALALLGIGGDEAAPDATDLAENPSAIANVATAAGGQTAQSIQAAGQPQQAAANAARQSVTTETARAGEASIIPVTSRAGKAFGGIMIPPTDTPVATSKQQQTDAAKALLQARAAVPHTNTANGIALPRTDRMPDAGAARDPETVSRAVRPSGPVEISPRLAEKLRQLATQSASPARPGPVSRPGRTDDTAQQAIIQAATTAPQRIVSSKPGARQEPPTTNGGDGKTKAADSGKPIPNLMMDALTKYEVMLRERHRKGAAAATPTPS